MTTAQMPKAPVSVIILTMNEEINIRGCLETVAWAGDVVLVDSGSRDRTVELARQARPDVRVLEHPFLNFGDQRNWALDNAQPAVQALKDGDQLTDTLTVSSTPLFGWRGRWRRSSPRTRSQAAASSLRSESCVA